MRIQTHNKHVCAKQAFKYTNAHIHTTRIHTHTRTHSHYVHREAHDSNAEVEHAVVVALQQKIMQ